MKIQDNNEFKKTKINKTVLCNSVIVLLLILTIILSIGLYAWAKYRSEKNEGASADVAKWYFRVIGDSEQSVDNIDFSITRTDTNRLC